MFQGPEFGFLAANSYPITRTLGDLMPVAFKGIHTYMYPFTYTYLKMEINITKKVSPSSILIIYDPVAM